jgi:ADP-ribosylation factor-like protein 8
VPLLVLANKSDLPGAIGVDEMIRDMRLAEIGGRVVSVSCLLRVRSLPQCYSTSNKTKHNLDIVLAWLTQRAQ